MPTITDRGRRLDLLFLISAIAGGTGTAYRGLSGADINSIAFLHQRIENTGKMQLAIGLDVIGSAIVVFIAIYVFLIVRKLNHQLGMAYVAIAMINFVVITLSNLVHISLLSVAADLTIAGTSDHTHYITLAKMHYEAYYWAHFLMLLLYGIGGSVLYYFLYNTHLLPRWLAVWGLFASLVVFLGGALQIVGISVSILFFVQNGLFILTFMGYLHPVGFRKTSFNPEISQHGV
ncbi:MAG: DUF4386 domain-containing protein [Bacteroidota bacterium]